MALSDYISGGSVNVDGMSPTGLAELLQQQQQAQQQQPMAVQQQNNLEQVSNIPKPKAFGKDGDGWKIVGMIGDALQITGGGQASYAPYVQDMEERTAKERQLQQQLQAKAQQAVEERQAALQDRKAIIDYQRQNPMPDSFAKALQGAGINPNSAEAQALYRKRAEMLTNPVHLVSDGMGGQVAVRPNESASGALQPGHTEDGYTFMGGDPADPSSWKQGGAASNGGGMFP